jgi:predicted aconitase with swiveling domain
MGRSLNGRVLVPGSATGEALVLEEPLSLWGGFQPETGLIVEVNHPQRGATVTGRILVMPSGRGSSSSATILAEAIRLGTAPSGIVLAEPDEILAIGSLAASELYGRSIPIVVADAAAYAAIADGETVALGS